MVPVPTVEDGDALPLLPASSSASELAASKGLASFPAKDVPTTDCNPHEPCFLRGGQEATPPQKQVQNKLLAALVLCVLFTALEFFGGFWAHSVAILADAAHMLSDAAGFGISLFAACAVTWRGHTSYSYGFHRVEIIGALLSTLMIWGVTGALVWEAIERILYPEPVNGKLMFIIACAGILFNVAIGFVLGAHHHHGLASHSGEGSCGGHSHSHAHAHEGCEHAHVGGHCHSHSHSQAHEGHGHAHVGGQCHSHSHSQAHEGHGHAHVGGHCHSHSHACSHGHGHSHHVCGHDATQLDAVAALKKPHEDDIQVPGCLDEGACKEGVVGLCNGKTGARFCNGKVGGEVCLSSATKVLAGEQHCEEDHPLSSAGGEMEVCCSKPHLHHRHPVPNGVLPHAHLDSSHAHVGSGCGHAHHHHLDHHHHHSKQDGLEVPDATSKGCCSSPAHHHHHHHHGDLSSTVPATLHVHADHPNGCGGHAAAHHHHHHQELHHVHLNENSGAKVPHAHGSGGAAGCCGGHEQTHTHSHQNQSPSSDGGNNNDDDDDDDDDDCNHGDHEGDGHASGHGHAHGGCCHQNMNMRSALLHVLGDLLQSIGVALAGLLIWIKQDDPRWTLADPICTFIFAALVLYMTQGIIRDIMRILMQRTPVQHDLAEISDSMFKVKGVHDVHDLHVWDLSLGLPILSAHVNVGAEASADRVLKRLECLFRRRGIINVM
ncbi:hypothetical protein DUNSADRAFT_9182 [Dunaliella salina]|uniref:Cation efflux protein transmembrane domain-containing protein n=1 Tax=Dunaliella salina TaxID=3046 RepID=A0ABQ7GHZ4_DUNSA|nr:hypothetical protein DUNSADRAFT_9182 [Dunaliella salina]|eukprot:KAF5834230.1 hypothetical protein DUNSADRAFT_9182 [Dunaliella salina]